MFTNYYIYSRGYFYSLYFSLQGTPADFKVMTSSPLIVTSPSPTAEVELFIMKDTVTLEGIENFNVTLELAGRFPMMSFSGAMNEFFINHVQVFIEDTTSMGK